MDAKSIEKACKQVFAKYPRLAGQSPRVSLQADGRYLLIFSSQAKTMNSKTIESAVRAVVDANGKVLKISSSR
jgi:hypothetical protein